MVYGWAQTEAAGKGNKKGKQEAPGMQSVTDALLCVRLQQASQATLKKLEVTECWKNTPARVSPKNLQVGKLEEMGVSISPNSISNKCLDRRQRGSWTVSPEFHTHWERILRW